MTKRTTAGYLTVFRVTEQLSRIMEATGVTRSELAKRLDVKPPAISRWFSPGRNLTIFTAAAIADALNLEMKVVFVESQTAQQKPPVINFIETAEQTQEVVHGTASFARTRGGSVRSRMRATELSLEDRWN